MSSGRVSLAVPGTQRKGDRGYGEESKAKADSNKVQLVQQSVAGGLDEHEFLRLVGGLERPSEHLLAEAIVAGARERGLELPEVQEFQSLTVRSVTGKVDGRTVALGNRKLLDELGVDPGDLAGRAEELLKDGQTVLFVAMDGKRAASWACPIRSRSPVWMPSVFCGRKASASSGSRGTAARRPSWSLANWTSTRWRPKCYRRKRPRRLSGSRARAAWALRWGTGTDVAMESAGVTLVKGDLRAIARARRLSRSTMRNICQNLFFAFVYNALGVPVVAGVLYPALGLLLNPMIASAAMSLSSVSVIANALRLRKQSL